MKNGIRSRHEFFDTLPYGYEIEAPSKAMTQSYRMLLTLSRNRSVIGGQMTTRCGHAN